MPRPPAHHDLVAARAAELARAALAGYLGDPLLVDMLLLPLLSLMTACIVSRLSPALRPTIMPSIIASELTEDIMLLIALIVLPAPEVRAFLDTHPLWNTLEEAYAVVDGDLTGILNGVDYETWNPAADPLIPARFNGPPGSGHGPML